MIEPPDDRIQQVFQHRAGKEVGYVWTLIDITQSWLSAQYPCRHCHGIIAAFTLALTARYQAKESLTHMPALLTFHFCPEVEACRLRGAFV